MKQCLYSSNACLIKPNDNLILSTFLAANNISIAEANSAAANSFKTKQLLSGSKFFKLFFGNKNIIFYILIIFFYTLFTFKVEAKGCLSFLPYGYNDSYVHLPENASFCVKYGNSKKNYITDYLGGRILINDVYSNSQKLKIFGDSQVLGLDIEKNQDHYLYKLYKDKTFIIYAAPNNGPYEVINFLNENKDIIDEKIIINFNLSVDLYRISDEWLPQNFVALKDYELDEILDFPFKYRIILFKNFLLNKNFEISRFNNKEMQNLFINSNHTELSNNLKIYLKKLIIIAKKFDIKVDLIFTEPYWIYSKNKEKNKLQLDEELNSKLNKLICDSINSSFINNFNNVRISEPKQMLKLDDLTIDRRHIKSNKIFLISLKKRCNI